MVKFAESILGIKRIELKTDLSTVEVRNRLWDLDQQPKRFQYNFTHVQIPDTNTNEYRVKLMALRRHRWLTLTLVYLDGLVSIGGDKKTVFRGSFKYGESYYFTFFGSFIIGFLVAAGGRDPAYPIFGVIFAAVILVFAMSLAHQQRGYLIIKLRKALAPLAS